MSRRTKKRWVVITIVFVTVLLIGAGVAAYFYFMPASEDEIFSSDDDISEVVVIDGQEVSQPEEGDDDTISAVSNELNQEARDYASAGDFATAEQLYQAEIDAAETDAQRAEYLLQLSSIFYDYADGDEVRLNEALDFGIAAEELAQTGESAANLAMIYEALGNSEQATYYWGEVDARSDS